MKRAYLIFLTATLLISLPVMTGNSLAYWQENGVPICTADEHQGEPQIISDGTGCNIIVWYDKRNGDCDIYAQRINADGQTLWGENGIPVIIHTGDQKYPRIVPDYAGGVIIFWQDYRDGNSDIYAQKLDAMGNKLWNPDGVPICVADNDQEEITPCTDGLSGAILAWSDKRSQCDIYAQRIDASGNPVWTTNGILIGSEEITSLTHDIYVIPDDANGAIFLWRPDNEHIYGQRLNSDGEPQWGPGGIPLVSNFGNYILGLRATKSENGCVIFTFARYYEKDLIAQKINSGGQLLWGTDGVLIFNLAEVSSALTSDNNGGAIIAWSYDSDVYAQRVDATGAVQWSLNGVCISSADYTQGHNLKIIGDGSGGAILAWNDNRAGILDHYDIYAQRIDANGDIKWTPNGVPIAINDDPNIGTILYSMSPYQAGGAVLAWEDYRDTYPDADIYCQMIDLEGKPGGFISYNPEIQSIIDVPGDQGGYVYLSFNACPYDYLGDTLFSHYTFWRSIKTLDALHAINNGALLLNNIQDIGKLDDSENRPVFRKALGGGREIFYWELIDRMDGYHLQHYSKTLPTLFDSTDVYFAYNYFQIIAHSVDPDIYWVSAIDSGYSVDNLAPCTPSGLKGTQSFIPEGLSISWSPNHEEDLSHYAIYRGLTEDFTPGIENLISTPTDTAYFDSDWRWDSGFYYKVSAFDIHGNESGFALLRPEDITEEKTPPLRNHLAQNYPNPFNPSTTIEYSLARKSKVTIKIYDVNGKLIRVLVNGIKSAGRHLVVWDGRDKNGRKVESGVYFYKIKTPDFTDMKKMVLLR